VGEKLARRKIFHVFFHLFSPWVSEVDWDKIGCICASIFSYFCPAGLQKCKMAAVVNSIPKLTNLWSTQLRCFHLSTFLSQIRVLTRPICTYSDYNPLLNQESLPRFKEIRPAHLAPAIEQLTKDFENDFIEFERTLKGNCKVLKYSN